MASLFVLVCAVTLVIAPYEIQGDIGHNRLMWPLEARRQLGLS